MQTVENLKHCSILLKQSTRSACYQMRAAPQVRRLSRPAAEPTPQQSSQYRASSATRRYPTKISSSTRPAAGRTWHGSILGGGPRPPRTTSRPRRPAPPKFNCRVNSARTCSLPRSCSDTRPHAYKFIGCLLFLRRGFSTAPFEFILLYHTLCSDFFVVQFDGASVRENFAQIS